MTLFTLTYTLLGKYTYNKVRYEINYEGPRTGPRTVNFSSHPFI